jgi:hypothetical protein
MEQQTATESQWTHVRGVHGWFHQVDHWDGDRAVCACGQGIWPWERLARTPWERLICPECRKVGQSESRQSLSPTAA